MNPIQQSITQRLAKGNVFVCADATATQIRCDQGTLWVTQDNDVRDIVIAAGEQFVADRNGSVLVYALSDASFSVASAQASPKTSFVRMIARWFSQSGSAKRGLVMAHG